MVPPVVPPVVVEPVGPGEYAVSVAPPRNGWKAYFVELAYPSPQPGLCEVYSTRVFVTPETRPFEGTQPPTAVTGMAPEDGALEPADGSRRASWLDDIFEDVAEEAHQSVLDELDRDLGERALRFCFARDVDDLDEVVELYARLGFGRSAEGVLEQRLEDLWRDLRDDGRDLVDDARDEADDVADEVDDRIDDLF